MSLPLVRGNAVDLGPSPCVVGEGWGGGPFQMVRPAEQSRPDTLRHRLTGSWLLRKWTPSQPSPQGEGQPLIAHDRSLLDSDALKSPAFPQLGGNVFSLFLEHGYHGN